MPEVRVSDATIHYERSGSGPSILLLHGLGSSGEDWEFQIAALDEGYDVIVPDFRGHGKSSVPAGPYSISRFGEDIVSLIEQLEVGPLVIVGISLGGMVGFQIAADRPDLVSRLIAVNALPVFEVTRISQKIQVAIRRLITKRLSMERIGDVLSKRLLPGDELAQRRATMVDRWARNDKAAYEATFEAILAWSGVAAAMAKTRVPITVMSSERDYVSPEDKHPYIQAMPTADTVIIEGAHHGVPIEYPERFNAALTKILVAG